MAYVMFALYCVAIGFIGNLFLKRMTKNYIKQIQETTKQACEELNSIVKD